MPKIINLTGQRFGRLIAVKPTQKRKRTYIVWECNCDCGNTTFVPSIALLSGNTKSCGCLQKERVFEACKTHLEGQRYGKLTVIKPTEMRKNGYVLWECRCDCGGTTFARTDVLTNGRKKSCGCLRGKANAQNSEQKNYG